MAEMPSSEEEDEEEICSVAIQWPKGLGSLETPESSPSLSPVSGGTFSFCTAGAGSPLERAGSPHGSDGFGPGLDDAETGAEVEGALQQLNISREGEPGVTEPVEEEMDANNESVSSWYTAELDEEVELENLSSWSTLPM